MHSPEGTPAAEETLAKTVPGRVRVTIETLVRCLTNATNENVGASLEIAAHSVATPLTGIAFHAQAKSVEAQLPWKMSPERVTGFALATFPSLTSGP